MIKRILEFFFDPLNAIGSMTQTEKLARGVHKRLWIIYVLAAIVTIGLLLFIYWYIQ